MIRIILMKTLLLEIGSFNTMTAIIFQSLTIPCGVWIVLSYTKNTFSHHSGWEFTLGEIWVIHGHISVTNATLSQLVLLIAITELWSTKCVLTNERKHTQNIKKLFSSPHVQTNKISLDTSTRSNISHFPPCPSNTYTHTNTPQMRFLISPHKASKADAIVAPPIQ